MVAAVSDDVSVRLCAEPPCFARFSWLSGEPMPSIAFPSTLAFDSHFLFEDGRAGRLWVSNDHGSRVSVREVVVGEVAGAWTTVPWQAYAAPRADTTPTSHFFSYT